MRERDTRNTREQHAVLFMDVHFFVGRCVTGTPETRARTRTHSNLCHLWDAINKSIPKMTLLQDSPNPLPIPYPPNRCVHQDIPTMPTTSSGAPTHESSTVSTAEEAAVAAPATPSEGLLLTESAL